MWWKRSSPWQRFRCAGFGRTPETWTIRTHGSVALAIFARGGYSIRVQTECATGGGGGRAGPGCGSAGCIPRLNCGIVTTIRCHQCKPHGHPWYLINGH